MTAGVFQEMQFVKNRLHSMASMVMGNWWKDKIRESSLWFMLGPVPLYSKD